MTASFYSVDPNPGKTLSSLQPSSSRVRSWIARAIQQDDFPFDREVQIRGAIDILAGLEYHHSRFVSQLAKLENFTSSVARPQAIVPYPPLLTNAQSEVLSDLQHEAVAYVNRVGQLHYFSDSLGRTALLPRVAQLLPFRHKYTSHRSVDKPRRETADELEAQAMTFGFGHAFIGGNLVFQIPCEGKFHMLDMQKDHPVVAAEAVALFESIYPLTNDA